MAQAGVCSIEEVIPGGASTLGGVPRESCSAGTCAQKGMNTSVKPARRENEYAPWGLRQVEGA
jgi:hypothetical protein